MDACGLAPDPLCLFEAIEGKCAEPYQVCVEGPCEPDCEGKKCGDDGCGGLCGFCPPDMECTLAGTCKEPQAGLTCEEILGCALGCGFSLDCVTDCKEQGTPKAQFQFEKLYSCLIETCGIFINPACIDKALEKECAEPFQVCQGQGPCEPDCLGKECGDDGCGDVCGKCKDGYVCTDFGQCELVEGLSCEEVFDCVMGCDGDPMCVTKCQNQGSPEGQELWGKLAACVIDICGLNLHPDCVMMAVENQCSEQFSVCMGEEPCEPDCEGKECGDDGCGDICGMCKPGYSCSDEGTCKKDEPAGLSCDEIYDCVMDCGMDIVCSNDCQKQGTPEGQEKFNKLFDCVVEVCGLLISPKCIEEAVENECQDEFLVCVGMEPVG